MLISTSRKTPPTGDSLTTVLPKVRFQSWLLLVVAFGSLLLLMIGSNLATIERASQLQSAISRVNETHLRNTRHLDQIKSGVQATRVIVRDFLLDASPGRGAEYRAKMQEYRSDTESHIRELTAVDRAKARQLLAAFAHYTSKVDSMFDWSAEVAQRDSLQFLREGITPSREVVTVMLSEIEKTMDSQLRENVSDLSRREAGFSQFLNRMMVATTILGLFVAFASVMRVRTLERRGAEQHRLTEQAEQELRRLSQQLVHAQEDERRSISRELHDEIGQMLTGLRMEFRGLSRLHGASSAEFNTRLEQGRVLLDQTLQAIRDVAMGLRPSMLDDLGLDAALGWQVREFGRHHDIPVTLNIDADLSNLPDQHRTNLYRIVQEALTNCARHSQAQSVTITIACKNGELRLVVADDGVGLNRPASPSGGLGLIGIQERARELHGTVRIDSTPGHGTSLTVSLPADWRTLNARHTSTAC